MEQLDDLVANAGDDLLHKLSFAVAEKDGRTLMVLATSGVVLGAWYLFTMLQRMFFGPVKEPHSEPGHGPSGDINGRAQDLRQLFTRPVARLDPYSTPNPRLFICSASTPPGGGVHGMCGYFAARSALGSLRRLPENLSPLR